MGRSWKRAQPQGPAPHQFLTRQNSLHWVMDMVFRDDECRVRTDHAPANFTCACRKLDPRILVMQSAKGWSTEYEANRLDGARNELWAKVGDGMKG
jgi:hypothetical protein